MNDFHENINRAQRELARLFKNLGPPTTASVQKALKVFEQYVTYPDIDSFYFVLGLRNTPWIKRQANVKEVLGIDQLSYETFFKLIHPQFLRIYLEFGIAAYHMGIKYRDEVASQNAYYAINVPIKRYDRPKEKYEYWWMKQVSIPLEFDKNNMMVSHLNIYRLIDRFQDSKPSKPLVVFNNSNRDDIEAQIASNTQQEILALFFSDLQPRYIETLAAYWLLYQQNGHFPTSQEVCDYRNRTEHSTRRIKKETISRYNQNIINSAKEVFPVSEFETVNDVVRFLHHLFGRLYASCS